MPLDPYKKQQLNDRLSNLQYLIADHCKIIEEVLIPYANRLVKRGKDNLEKIAKQPTQPVRKEMKETALDLRARTEAKELISMYETQKPALEQIRQELYGKVSDTFLSDPASKTWLDTRQKTLVKKCYDDFWALVETQKVEEKFDTQDLLDDEQILNEYNTKTVPEDEGGFMSALRAWSIANPETVGDGSGLFGLFG